MNIERLQAWKASKGYHLLPIKPGMQLELHEQVGDGSNKRIWKFKGLVLKVKKPNHPDGTFTIRGKTAGHTIEKIYPLSFQHFEKVILSDEYKIRRAKLYYIRDKVGKDARMKSILSKEEKNIDLLVLAREEAVALQKAYEKKGEEKVEEKGEKKGEEKKNTSRDAQLIACNEEHEMIAVLKAHDKENTAENRELMKAVCKEFKGKEDLKPHNRDNFYKYLSSSENFAKISAAKK